MANQATIETLEKEKVELLQRILSAEECIKSLSEERNYLKILVADLQSEAEIANRNMAGLTKTIEKTVAANLELQDQLRATSGYTKGCHEILEEAKANFSEKSTQTSDAEEKPNIDELNQKLEQLTSDLSLQMSEKEQLLSENKWRKENFQQIMMDTAYLKKVMAVLWDTVSSLKTENKHLRSRMTKFFEKEVADRLPIIEKKKEYIERVAVHLRNELTMTKSLVDKVLVHLLPKNVAVVQRLQSIYEEASISLCCLLDEVKFFFPIWFKDNREFYTHLSNCSTDLLQENIKHLQLLVEAPSLKSADEWCERFKICRIPGLREKLDEFLENVLQDISNLEQELCAIEAKVQELESSQKGQLQITASTAIIFNLTDFIRRITNDTQRLQAVLGALRSKSQALSKARSAVVARHACICWEAEAVIMACRKKSEEQHQEQHQEQELATDPGAEAANEEAKKLELNLSTVEQDMVAVLDAEATVEQEEGGNQEEGVAEAGGKEA